MKRLKKAGALVLALLMTFVFAIPAMAAEVTPETTYSITIQNENDGHTYQAYQIFAGDVSSDNAQGGNEEGPILSNITWGSGVNGDALLAALKAANSGKYGNCTTAKDVAEALGAENAASADAEAFADVVANNLSTVFTESTFSNNTYKISGLAAGYYLVVDSDDLVDGEPPLQGSNDAYSEYIVQVLGNVQMAPKSDVPTAVKKVDDKNDSNTEEDQENWQDSADYDIGDHVPFQITITLPDNLDAYETYMLNISDRLSNGLVYNENSTKITIDGKQIETVAEGDAIEPHQEDAKHFIWWDFNNIKANVYGATNGSEIVITYTATLTKDAVIGSKGNPNTMHVEFSNNPNGTGTGTTPVDTVVVFTYQTIVNKVRPANEGEERNQPLSGAKFTLEKFVASDEGTETYKNVQGNWVEKTVVENQEGTTFTFTGLDDGEYRLTETVTPTGYNTIDPIEFTITATHEATSDDPQLTALNGNVATGEITFTSDTTDGSLTTDVVNVSGSTLPETGGMGTTVFYVVGGVIVAGVLVLLVAKRRMGRAE